MAGPDSLNRLQAKGYSGISLGTLQQLIDAFNG
jgi:hypothetical protein